MCGITGLFSKEGVLPFLSEFERANYKIFHRGPDGQGAAFFSLSSSKSPHVLHHESHISPALIHSDARFALGHRRLAILDLSKAGLQPMSAFEHQFWITYNGEIYNYIELREELEKLGHQFYTQTDTEVILHAYQAWGENCVHRFNGIWAFAILDRTQNRLFCSRDRFGVKPFHYFFDRNHFVFGSEIKQLLEFSFIRRRMNRRAIYEYLAFSAVDYCEETFFDGILKLSQGCNLIFDLNQATLSTHRYYHPPLKLDTQISLEEASKKFLYLFKDSIRLQLRSDVEVGSCLSGGLDSTSIVCLARQILSAQGKESSQHTFSTHFEDEEANEISYMNQAIQFTGVRAHFISPSPEEMLDATTALVRHQDEPFGSTSMYAQWFVFKLVHQHGIKVMLDGQGSDEMLAGYLSLTDTFFKDLHLKRRYVQLAHEVWKHTMFHSKPYYSPSLLKGVGKILPMIFPEKFQSMKPLHCDWIDPVFKEKYHEQSIFLSNQKLEPFGPEEHLNNVLYWFTFHNNLQGLLRYEDRSSMAFSVESRVPFLDHRLVEFLFSLPADFKIKSGYTKRVLRHAMQGVIPEKIRLRVSKLGFATPERQWRKTALLPLIREAVLDERLQPFIQSKKALDYLDYLNQNNLSHFAAWNWANLYLWIKEFDVS